MVLICIKQQLSKIWNSIYETVKKHWGWVEKKRVAYKKGVYFVGTTLAVGVKAYLVYFLFRREFQVVFAGIEKHQFFSSRFRGFWNCDLNTNLFNGFL